MNMSEVKEMPLQELLTKGRDLRHELFNLNLQKATSQLEKPHRVTALRRDIARIETQIAALRKKKS